MVEKKFYYEIEIPFGFENNPASLSRAQSVGQQDPNACTTVSPFVGLQNLARAHTRIEERVHENDKLPCCTVVK